MSVSKSLLCQCGYLTDAPRKYMAFGQMEQFAEQARSLQIRGVIMTGSTFGLFVTVGSSWGQLGSVFMDAIIPDVEGELLNQLVRTVLSTLAGTVMLYFIYNIGSRCSPPVAA